MSGTALVGFLPALSKLTKGKSRALERPINLLVSIQTITLSKEAIERCRTERGAFTKATVEAFGLGWNTLQAGWPNRLIGKSISLEQYQKALEGRERFKRSKCNRDEAQPNPMFVF